MIEPDDGRIYGQQGDKACTCCGNVLAINTENFYTRTRSNGRTYFTAKCKICIKSKRSDYRADHPKLVKQSADKCFEKNSEKYNANRRAKFAADPLLRAEKNRKTHEWLLANVNYVIAYRVAYRDENSIILAARARNYYYSNKENFRVYRQVRKGYLRGASGSFTKADLDAQRKDQFGKCFWCRSDIGDDCHADHYIPVSRGGSNKPYNIVLSCPTCNISRGAKMPCEFFAYMKKIAGMMPEIEKKREYFRNRMRAIRAL